MKKSDITNELNNASKNKTITSIEEMSKQTDEISDLYDIKMLKSDLDEALDLDRIQVSEELIQSTLNLAKQQNQDNAKQDTDSQELVKDIKGKNTKVKNIKVKKSSRKRPRAYQYGMIAACVGVIVVAGICIATGSLPINGLGSESKKDCATSMDTAESTTSTETTQESSDMEDATASITTESANDSFTSGNDGASENSSDSTTSLEDDQGEEMNFFTWYTDAEQYKIVLEDIKEIIVYDSNDNIVNTLTNSKKLSQIYDCMKDSVSDNQVQNVEHKGQYKTHYVIIAYDKLSWSELDIKVPKMAENETTYQIQRQLKTSEGNTLEDTITNVDPSVIESIDTLLGQ